MTLLFLECGLSSGILGRQQRGVTGGDIPTSTPTMSSLSTHLRSFDLALDLSRLIMDDSLQVKQEGDLLYTRRLVLKTNSLPSWGKHFFKDAKVAVIEECVVDRTKPSLTWYTR